MVPLFVLGSGKPHCQRALAGRGTSASVPLSTAFDEIVGREKAGNDLVEPELVLHSNRRMRSWLGGSVATRAA